MHIANSEVFAECFGDALGGLLSTTAQNIAVHMQSASPAVWKIKSIRGGTRDAQVVIRPGTDAWAVPGTCVHESKFADMQSEESRHLIVELTRVTDPARIVVPAGAPLPVLDVRVTFDNVQTSEAAQTVTARCAVQCVTPEALVSAPCTPHMGLSEQDNRLLTVAALAEARRQAASNNLAAAQDVLSRTTSMLTQTYSAASPSCSALVADLHKVSLSLRSQHEYAARGSKTLNSIEQSHGYERSCMSSASPCYVTPSKASSRMHSKEFVEESMMPVSRTSVAAAGPAGMSSAQLHLLSAVHALQLGYDSHTVVQAIVSHPHVQDVSGMVKVLISMPKVPMGAASISGSMPPCSASTPRSRKSPTPVRSDSSVRGRLVFRLTCI
jgi:hypothetical protein